MSKRSKPLWLCSALIYGLLVAPAEARDNILRTPDEASAAPCAAAEQKVDNFEVAQACCKTCRKGKACGDSCISRDKECTKPRGCACDG